MHFRLDWRRRRVEQSSPVSMNDLGPGTIHSWPGGSNTMRAIRLGVACLAGLLATAPAWGQPAATEKPGSTSSAEAARPSEWSLWIRPYFFLSGVSGSVTAEPLTFPVNSTFAELVKNVKMGAFVAFSAEKGPWGLYADLQYISLAGEGTSTLGARLTLENIIAEADFTFRPSAAPTLRFLVGLRVYSLDQTLAITGQPEIEANTTVYDPILGAMGEWQLSRRWGFEVRGDIGGFGISSEFTYQMMVLFRAGLSDAVSIPFGYRVLGYQINTGGVSMNTRMTGLVLGVDLRL